MALVPKRNNKVNKVNPMPLNEFLKEFAKTANKPKPIPKVKEVDYATMFFEMAWTEFRFLAKTLFKRPVVIVFMAMGIIFALDVDANGEDSFYREIMNKLAEIPMLKDIVTRFLIPYPQRVISTAFFIAVFFAVKDTASKVIIVITGAVSIIVIDSVNMNFIIALILFAVLEIKTWYVTAILAVVIVIYAWYYFSHIKTAKLGGHVNERKRHAHTTVSPPHARGAHSHE